LEWVGCHKCTKWVHSVCAVSGSWVADLPAELREEMEASGEGVWFDWPARVDKW
jgi:hypothetical protein